MDTYSAQLDQNKKKLDAVRSKISKAELLRDQSVERRQALLAEMQAKFGTTNVELLVKRREDLRSLIEQNMLQFESDLATAEAAADAILRVTSVAKGSR